MMPIPTNCPHIRGGGRCYVSYCHSRPAKWSLILPSEAPGLISAVGVPWVRLCCPQTCLRSLRRRRASLLALWTTTRNSQQVGTVAAGLRRWARDVLMCCTKVYNRCNELPVVLAVLYICQLRKFLCVGGVCCRSLVSVRAGIGKFSWHLYHLITSCCISQNSGWDTNHAHAHVCMMQAPVDEY